MKVIVVGAGLAGAEACNYLLKRGYEVHLYEKRPKVDDHAHHTGLFAELVCSNSLKSNLLTNACGLLKQEMRLMDSLTMEAASFSSIPSGNALSVDRDIFASYITEKLKEHPNLFVHEEEVDHLDFDCPVIIATGPLTSSPLLKKLEDLIGEGNLSFFDASAPIIEKDSIDFSIAYYKSRWDQGDESYINCPFDRDQYFAFVNELIHAEKALLHEFDTKYFEGCLPVEVIASRGIETLRHGPLKPFGLQREGYPKAYAVLQLRQDSKLGDYYNMVGFQTNLTYPEQRRVFKMIPGLNNANFVRYGLMHRNSYICSPIALNEDLSLKKKEDVYIAGQLSGVEGYVESAYTGMIAARNLDRKLKGKQFLKVPVNTIGGALIDYIVNASPKGFAPMNANWALLPNSDKRDRTPSIDASLEAVKSYWGVDE